MAPNGLLDTYAYPELKETYLGFRNPATERSE